MRAKERETGHRRIRLGATYLWTPMIIPRLPSAAGLAALVIFAFASCGPADALEATDTMTAWKGASGTDKAKLLKELLKRDGREGEASGVARCLDSAASFPGHADLSIGRVLKACEQDQGEPV